MRGGAGVGGAILGRVFLTISTTGTLDRPATDLGFLLHKHPGKAQAFGTSHGTAHVFYPEASEARCTVALLLEVDAVGLVRKGREQGRGRSAGPDTALAQYVNDRPYAASSLLAVALATVFRTALGGTCKNRPDLEGRVMPLRVEIPALPARGGAPTWSAACSARWAGTRSRPKPCRWTRSSRTGATRGTYAWSWRAS